jgi:GTP-binding protein
MIKKASFLVSNSDFRKCPETHKPEVALIGRSNVGKSSLINMLTNNKNLAKTSGTPGKTQLINHFDIDDKWLMVDLPGYGFAKASKSLKKEWDQMIRGYLTGRKNLQATFVLIDSRLEPQKIDIDFILWCAENEIPVVLIFTKADKLSNSKVKGNVHKFIQALSVIFEETPLYFISSAEKGTGKEEIITFIEALVQDYYEEQR